MATAEPLLLLASENPIKGAYRVESPAPGVVAAVTAGDGPPINPKVTVNEDSVALVAMGSDVVAALIADSHFGHAAGEIAVRTFARAMARAPVGGHAGLRDLIVDLDRAIRADRDPDDVSETTALAVLYRPGAIEWACVGDSALFLAVPGQRLRGLAPRRVEFLGGPTPLDGAAGSVVASGSTALPPGAVVLMASDGIDLDYSGMTEARVNEILLAPEPLEARVSVLMSEAGSVGHGGGHDNLSVVAMTSPP